MIPNDFKNAIAAINFGEPVVLRAPKSEISPEPDSAGRNGRCKVGQASVAGE